MEQKGLFVVSDRYGFVGAFPTLEIAQAATIEKYTTIPFVVRKYRMEPGPCNIVWVVIFRDIDAVAFVSNDRNKAEAVKKDYDRIGATYPESIDTWEQPFGKVVFSAEQHLEPCHRAHLMYEVPPQDLSTPQDPTEIEFDESCDLP